MCFNFSSSLGVSKETSQIMKGLFCQACAPPPPWVGSWLITAHTSPPVSVGGKCVFSGAPQTDVPPATWAFSSGSGGSNHTVLQIKEKERKKKKIRWGGLSLGVWVPCGHYFALMLLFSRWVLSDSFTMPWTIAHQAPLFMGFSRQESWSGLPSPPSGDPPNPGMELASPLSRQGSPVLLLFTTKDAKSWLIWKDPNAGKDGRQEEKGMTEDEMAGWHHGLNGHEFE